MLENLIYSQKKSLLTKQLEAGNVPENAIAFIGDTKLIYTLGLYFGGGYTKEEIDALLGDINAALDYIINGPPTQTFTVTISESYGGSVDGLNDGDILTFEYLPGMTWEDWLNSEYNTKLFKKTGNLVYITLYQAYIYNNNVPQNLTDTITSSEYIFSYICCFVQGTKVTMADNTTKNIENIIVGDKVLSYDIINNCPYEVVVKNTIINNNSVHMAKITTESGNTLTFTDYHPLLTTNGWKSITNYNNYETLLVGDTLVTINGTDKIVNIERWNESTPISTYTLNVVDFGENPDIDVNDNFYVNGFIGHNAGCAS